MSENIDYADTDAGSALHLEGDRRYDEKGSPSAATASRSRSSRTESWWILRMTTISTGRRKRTATSMTTILKEIINRREYRSCLRQMKLISR